ncbi:bifunctional diguanylate cyclase/phosphohydrolase [Desulfotomaculum sp. 1211_IL3151]|uniref:bifunctional diguanylate cyclase/phosphohydrolase n=1 Tax=Desulfotomaculum sp. 1211_IL3151 TaxID=3084055 RepID=UPI002FD96D7E
MNDWQKERDINFNELKDTVYLLCCILFTVALLLKVNWNISVNQPFENIFVFLVENFVPINLFVLALIYSIVIVRMNSVSTGFLLLSTLVFVLMAIFNDSYFRELLIIPVAYISFAKNKAFGCFIALMSGILLCIGDLLSYGFEFPNGHLEASLLFTCVMFICAWLIGGIASIERETRGYLLALANKDGLTETYNHRFFHVYFRQMLDEAKGSNSPLSLLIFDIDYFKFYNDTFGHLSGDEVLRGVGQILQQHIQQPNIAARYGGDEFCILLPGHNSAAAVVVARKLKESIERYFEENEQFRELPEEKFSITMGLASYPEHSKTGDDLLDLADQALYKAKKTSKNKIELYFNVLDSLKGICDQSELGLLSSTKTLLSIINAKDRYTYGHSERVLEYATKLAQRCGLDEDEVRLIQYGAYLHDIGKIEVDINILNATEKLSEKEWQILKQHSYWGSEFLRPIKSLEIVRPYILYHHENYDGTGYPAGIKGNDIPLGARIIRIADSFDAMTTDRPYKKGKSYLEACSEIIMLAGKHYDPELSKLFVRMIETEHQLCNEAACSAEK